MKCKNFRVRTEDYNRYFFCKSKKCKITYRDCQNCSEIDLKKNKAIKKKSKRLANLERNRISSLQDNCKLCFLCNRELELDKHEAFRRIK